MGEGRRPFQKVGLPLSLHVMCFTDTKNTPANLYVHLMNVNNSICILIISMC